jgi:hypothetical protein
MMDLALHGTSLALLRSISPANQLLIQATPVNANSNRFTPTHGGLYHLRKLQITFIALADIARIDAVLGEGLRALRIVSQQTMTVVVKITDQGHIDTHSVKLLPNRSDRHCRFGRVDRQSHQLRARQAKLLDLNCCTNHIHCIGIGHGLHSNRCPATHRHHPIAPDDLRLP